MDLPGRPTVTMRMRPACQSRPDWVTYNGAAIVWTTLCEQERVECTQMPNKSGRPVRPRQVSVAEVSVMPKSGVDDAPKQQTRARWLSLSHAPKCLRATPFKPRRGMRVRHH